MKYHWPDVSMYLVSIFWNVAILGGCAYLVFWRDASPWWFLLAVILLSAWSDD